MVVIGVELRDGIGASVTFFLLNGSYWWRVVHGG